jgi:uncharacterized protein YgiM (DUF1202 family)
MLKIIVSIMISFLLFLSSSLVLALEFPFLGEVNKDKINLRAGPSINYESLYKLTKGEKLRVISEKYNWYKVVLPEYITCFISKKYVKRINKRDGIVTGSRVNLRAGPDNTATIIGQVNKNQRVKIIRILPEWYAISTPLDLAFGWVHKKFIDSRQHLASDIKNLESKQLEGAVKIEPKEEIVNRKQTLITQKEKSKAKIASNLTNKEIKKADSQITASGKIYPMGIFLGRRGSHKLVKDNKLLYYLKGEEEILNNFIGFKVNVFGKIIDEDKKIPLIIVERIEKKN